MFKNLFSGGEGAMLDLPVVVMLFFLVVFAVVLFRVFARGRRAHYEHMAHLPLEDELTTQPKEMAR